MRLVNISNELYFSHFSENVSRLELEPRTPYSKEFWLQDPSWTHFCSDGELNPVFYEYFVFKIVKLSILIREQLLIGKFIFRDDILKVDTFRNIYLEINIKASFPQNDTFHDICHFI